MIHTPILVLAYNRPSKVKDLIDSLRLVAPRLLVFNIDGPKKERPSDNENIESIILEIEKIDWDCRVEVRTSRENKGIRRAIPEAVSYVMAKYGKSIILEEDVVVGPQAIDFANRMLEKFEHSPDIGHISLYNIVDKGLLSSPDEPIRLSRYPESIAWATWEASWSKYADGVDLRWLVKSGVIHRFTKNFFEKLSWLTTFGDVDRGHIASWAYRWIASLWRNGLYSVSPNENLVRYSGFDEGSHTTRKAPWKELPVGRLEETSDKEPLLDESADLWLSKKIFGGTFLGFLMRMATSVIRLIWKDKN
jgi:hypothetical protein